MRSEKGHTPHIQIIRWERLCFPNPERTAFVKAVSEGERAFRAIAVIGGAAGGPLELAPPCGICRQVMREFCAPDTFEIILGTGPEDFKVYTLSQLLPLSFGPENLEKQETV